MVGGRSYNRLPECGLERVLGMFAVEPMNDQYGDFSGEAEDVITTLVASLPNPEP
jgi:hypothetical protein